NADSGNVSVVPIGDQVHRNKNGTLAASSAWTHGCASAHGMSTKASLSTAETSQWHRTAATNKLSAARKVTGEIPRVHCTADRGKEWEELRLSMQAWTDPRTLFLPFPPPLRP